MFVEKADEINFFLEKRHTMSQVYTQSAVQQGNIPDEEDFQVVLSLFRKAIAELYERMPSELPAATVFGSCAGGNQNVCSDIDIMILVDDRRTSNEAIYREVRLSTPLTEAMKEARGMFVQTSIYPVVFSKLSSSKTKNDRQFLKHVVTNSQRGLICGDHEAFLSFFKVAPVHTLSRMLAYTGRKIEKLEERLFCFSGLSEEDKARMWLDAHQAPFHAVRRLLDLMNMSGHSDTKKGIAKAFHEIAGDKFAFPLFDLKERWGQYVSYIEEAKSHKGKTDPPFVIEDVHKALFVLRKVQTLAENVCPAN